MVIEFIMKVDKRTPIRSNEMNWIKVEATNGKEIKIEKIPQAIVEYAEYYAELEADGMTPMSFEDWKAATLTLANANADWTMEGWR